ncbi:transcriptional regulator [Ruminococcus sp. AF14-10]|nr:transcriptional regulator [Ruminococcus sp. AF14-10]
MSRLSQIESFIKPCVDVISTFVHTQITVVDEELNRICGTNFYKEVPEKFRRKSSVFFQKVLISGYPKLVTQVREDPYCEECKSREICTIHAELGYPIDYQGEIIGVIGIAATETEEANYLIENQERLIEFMKYLGILIANQLESVEQTEKLEQQLSEVSQATARYHIMGSSPKMKEMIKMGYTVANSDSTVLLTGESGTGKEEFAKFLHANSQRNKGPMIAVNCGAIPGNLIESELFGYEGGSFTGAKKGGAIGKFELADKGTLFLDEVGELPLMAQTKLLRALQERKIERVGGTKEIPVNIRIVAATNKNLREMVKKGMFREDLYYRLSVIPMEIPPLRERGKDIKELAYYFLRDYNKILHKNIHGFDYQAEMTLETYEWPGNVRELKNVVEFLVNMVQGDLITVGDLPQYMVRREMFVEQRGKTLNQMLQNYEKSILESYIKDTKNREEKMEAAKKLGISQATLYRKLSQYDL